MIIPTWLTTAFGVYLLSTLIGSVWWASSIATTLNYMKESIDKLEHSNVGYVQKPECIKDMANQEREISAQWKRIEKIENIVFKTGG